LQDKNESFLLYLHLNKLENEPTDFDTVIIDEAQDAPLAYIHFMWLKTKNLILTGDELQTENIEGIGSWNNLGKLRPQFSLENGRLNVFTLRHNFRQTYELGNCSFNFRQLALNKAIIDINNEYFENQKGFPKPQLAIIENLTNFIVLVKDKIHLIQKEFTNHVPVVIFYENDVSLDRLSSVLKEGNISYSYDGDESNLVMFVSLENIAGRSFPVVTAPLINNTKDNSLYIMLTRAMYDLCLFTGKSKNINTNIMTLLSKKIIINYNEKRSQ